MNLDKISNPKNTKFNDLYDVCTHYWGNSRNKSSSHFIFKTGIQYSPLINIQVDKKNKKMAKEYQVKQVLKILEMIGEC